MKRVPRQRLHPAPDSSSRAASTIVVRRVVFKFRAGVLRCLALALCPQMADQRSTPPASGALWLD